MCHDPMGQILSSSDAMDRRGAVKCDVNLFFSKWIQESALFITTKSHLWEILVNYFLMTYLI